jgi:hypothetical protein
VVEAGTDHYIAEAWISLVVMLLEQIEAFEVKGSASDSAGGGGNGVYLYSGAQEGISKVALVVGQLCDISRQ